MIDTTSFECDVVITSLDENKRILEISNIDSNNKVVSVQKIRKKKIKTQESTEGVVST